MNVRFYATLEQAERDVLANAAVVVIDVLRASTTIIAALESGAERVIPIAEIEAASRLVRPSERDKKLLAGERKCCPVPGFDLCNSPGDFTPACVRGKTVVFTTTNGTRALAAAAKAPRVLVGALTNISAVTAAVRGEEELAVLCCGSEGGIASEDLLCGGMLVAGLGEAASPGSLGDAAHLALLVAERYGGSPEPFLRSTDHGRRLLELGFERDIVFAARVGVSDCVPALTGGAIVRS